MQHAGGLCRKPHVCRTLTQYHIYKFLRYKARAPRPAAHPCGPPRPLASNCAPTCPARPPLTVGVDLNYLKSLDRTLNKPPAPVQRDRRVSCRQSAVFHPLRFFAPAKNEPVGQLLRAPPLLCLALRASTAACGCRADPLLRVIDMHPPARYDARRFSLLQVLMGYRRPPLSSCQLSWIPVKRILYTASRGGTLLGCRGGRIGTTAKDTVTVTSPARVRRACAVVTASWLLAPPYLTLQWLHVGFSQAGSYYLLHLIIQG